MSQKSDGGSGRKGSNNLVALGSMAVLGVYAAGYARTEAAAERFAQQAQRRPTAVIARAPEASAGPSAVQAPAQAAPSGPVAGASATAPATPATSVNGVAKSAPASGAKQANPPSLATTGAKDSTAVAAAAGKEPATVVAAAPVKPASTVAPAAHTDSAPPKPAPVAQPAVDSAALKAPAWKDGAYIGYGTSRHGDIEATIEIRNGKIISASISQCRTQYSCSWIAALPPQVITRQSAEVDYISGATQSSNAFYGAIVDALNKAK